MHATARAHLLLAALLLAPVMGAAAFLIAEFLRISYVEVIKLAVIPAALYYWSLLLMVEFDAKKFGNIKFTGVNESIPDGWEGVDIGPETVKLFSEEICRWIAGVPGNRMIVFFE